MKFIENALPCPFCGHINLAFISDVDGDGRDTEFIVCMNDNCLAEGPFGKDKNEALERWNNRYNQFL